ncbi:MAG TPA: XDD4 family exosortase-dependent surface protein [Phycisphaerae bacterium]|nr:XDD4 family exosortase-dependent surface protein [Phycisphaerae bacterium]
MCAKSCALVAVLATCVVLGASVHAVAGPVTFESSAGDRAAAVTFDTMGDRLWVTLANTSTSDVLVPADVLTAVFFEVDAVDPLMLTPVSAVLGPGSSVLFGVSEPGGSVGGEWVYADDLSGSGWPFGYGIGAGGFGLFGPVDRFGGVNLEGPESPGGLEYGLTSTGDDPTTGNTPVTGKNALIQNEVVFTLSGLPDGFDPSMQISGVRWQYGTSLDEAHLPEPASAALVLCGAVALLRRRR